VIQEFCDAAVSGADPIDARTAFTDMMAFCGNGGPKVVLVENASRFARDLIVQLTGHEMMKKASIELIPVDAPDFFTHPTPTAEMAARSSGQLASSRRQTELRNSSTLGTASERKQAGAKAGSRCRPR
jgi:DNA invertase Pin-like site-specific DNA recombinase